MDLLKRFNADVHTKDELKKWFNTYLENEVVDRVFSGKDIVGYKEARKIIEDAFDSLNNIYGELNIKKKTTETAR
jgi:inorganic pyrophosphatase